MLLNTGPFIFFIVFYLWSLSITDVERVLADIKDVFDEKLLLFSSVAFFFFLYFFLRAVSSIEDDWWSSAIMFDSWVSSMFL